MSYVSNSPVYREYNSQGQAMLRRADRYFVERKDDGSWAPAAPEDKVVSHQQLGEKYGLWQDKEITEGSLWWKKTVRPLDGKIDADEVLPMGPIMSQPYDSYVYRYPNPQFAEYDRLISKNTQLELTTSGGILHTDWETQFRHTERTWSAFTSSYLVE